MTDSERRALESRGRGGLASSPKPASTSPEIQYGMSIHHSPSFHFITVGEVYYLLYADDYEISSKVPFNPEEPSLGRISADSIPPPHSPTSIKRCISRVEGNPALVNSDLFADTTCNTPLKEGQILIFRTDGPGLSLNEPMAIVQARVQVESPLPVEAPSIPNGRYVIKNQAANTYWAAPHNPFTTVYFWHSTTMEYVKKHPWMQVNILQLFYCSEDNSLSKWDITQVGDGTISMTSPHAPSSWVGAELIGSAVPVPWRLIPADSNSY